MSGRKGKLVKHYSQNNIRESDKSNELNKVIQEFNQIIKENR